MQFGETLASFMARLVASFAPRLGYVISKGGITTHTFLEEGLCLKVVYLEGQILPGLSVVRPLASNKFKDLPIITFPGNLGDFDGLFVAWRLLESS